MSRSPSTQTRVRVPAQGELFRGWGGARAGAGRKPSGARPSVPHVARPEHKARHPVHLTLRAVRRLPSLRKQNLFLEIRRALPLCSSELFRVVHFSVQADHVHLLVEAEDKKALSRGARGLAIRLARKVNGVLRRSGHVWGDRYHARPLSTPREVRHALVYVLANWRKHVPRAQGLDPCASAGWFDGWRGKATLREVTTSSIGPPPVVASRTWLGSVGWRRYGLIDWRERPVLPSPHTRATLFSHDRAHHAQKASPR
jgi:REP element-mobilizing transposase RayT